MRIWQSQMKVKSSWRKVMDPGVDQKTKAARRDYLEEGINRPALLRSTFETRRLTRELAEMPTDTVIGVVMRGGYFLGADVIRTASKLRPDQNFFFIGYTLQTHHFFVRNFSDRTTIGSISALRLFQGELVLCQ